LIIARSSPCGKRDQRLTWGALPRCRAPARWPRQETPCHELDARLRV